MIKIGNEEVYGWNAAIRGMRNPMNSWEKSDTEVFQNDYYFGDSKATVITTHIGENDLNLMKKLVKTGTDHRKFLRMINVTVDIMAPLYWWKEFDTYKVGTVRNSCSTMHKITAKKFTLDDFSHEHLTADSLCVLEDITEVLNEARDAYLEYNLASETFQASITKKDIWWQIIQLLPSSYNQRATVQLNYEVLLNIYHSRKNHKLDEWRTFCEWIEELPYMKEFI